MATAFCFSQFDLMTFGSIMYGIATLTEAEVMICWKAAAPSFGSPVAISLPIGVSFSGLSFSRSSGIMPRYSAWSVSTHQSYGVLFCTISPVVFFLIASPRQKRKASSGVLRTPMEKASGEFTECKCCSPK